MAVFPQSYYTTTITTNTYATGTNGLYFANKHAAYDRALMASLVPKPVGEPITDPQVGMWIAERTPGGRARKIVEVRKQDGFVVCQGRRHSLISWENLHRYAQVDENWPV